VKDAVFVSMRQWNKPLYHLPNIAFHGVLPLESNLAYFLGDLLLQHPDALVQEAEEKGRVQQFLADRLAKVYKMGMALAA
jgi:hypothetical protein